MRTKSNSKGTAKVNTAYTQTENTTNNVIDICGTDITIKEYMGQRVVTFKDIDRVHNRPVGAARKSFNNNKKRFTYGEDYFVQKSDEARKQFNITAPNGLVLITQTGYLMLVKSLTDDLAWRVQRELVKSYFVLQEIKKEKAVSFDPYTFCNGIFDKSEAGESKNNIKSAIWQWKHEISTPYIEQIAFEGDVEMRKAFDAVYCVMREQYGFSPTSAVMRFKSEYNYCEPSVINAIAVNIELQKQFVESAKIILSQLQNCKRSQE